jgi:GNAT superfamily N-acetyltransferase
VSARLEFRELTRRDWPVVERLFGSKGACGGCWCMWWRVERGGKRWEQTKGARAKRLMKRLVAAGRVHVVIAYDGKQPVGWCTFGPRGDFPRLETVKAYRPPDDAAVWSIPCFFILPSHRGRGVGRGGGLASSAGRRHARFGCH